MKKIVILDAKTLGTDQNLDVFSKFGQVKTYETTTPEETISRVSEAEIIVTNKVVIDKNVMDHCPCLKLICISATGTNNIDLKAARERGIEVKNAVDYSSHSVAQHTIACILQLYNQLTYYDKYVKKGVYSGSDIFTHHGPPIIELHDKTLGIIGLGNIGKTVAKIARAFEAKVCYYSTSGKNSNDSYPQLPLDELLRSSDIVSIHAPLNENTRHLISNHHFEKMRSNGILINVGRGGIVDEQALANAIDHHQIAGACIDVYEHEPIPADHPLLKVKYPEKLILTPHSAWASVEARRRLVDIVYTNIEEFIHGNV